MKRFIVIAAIAAMLTVLLGSTALAAGPVVGRWAQGTNPPSDACPMGGAGAGMMGRPSWAGQPDTVPDLLGMAAAEIQKERLAGKSLAQIAAAKDISEQALIDAILGAKKTLLQQAVTDGKLTQPQADAMIQNMQAMVKTMVERTTTGPQGRPGMMGGQGQGMMRGYGMRGEGAPGGGMRGRGMWGQQAPNTTAGASNF